MKDLNKHIEILKKAQETDFAQYKEVLEYCNKRITAEEGIPAIIGLSDLRENGNKIFKGAKSDQVLCERMAIEAAIFNYLVTQQVDKNERYPTIAIAMSALAEKCSLQEEGKENPTQYRELLGVEIK